MTTEINQNELFLQEFNHFKDHPEDYESKKEGLFPIATIVFFSIFVFLGIILNTYVIENIDAVLFGILAYLAIGAIGLYMLAGYLIEINKRIHNFNGMVYIGKASELFIEMNHPVIKQFKDKLIHDFKEYNGIRGSTAYDIHYHMTDARIKKVMKEKELANQAIEEMENI
jgi:hypothetical protein